jgi:hypothetical protein
MIVLSPETEQLVRLIAERSRKTPERVLNDAVEAYTREAGMVPPQEPPSPAEKPSFDRMMAISDRFSTYPVLDDHRPDETIDYDQFGQL